MNYKILAIVADWRGANDASFAYAFRDIGNEVEIINVKKFFNTDYIINRVVRKVYRQPPIWEIIKFNEEIIRRVNAFRPNIIFVAKGLWIKPETIDYLKSKGIYTIHWHPDDAFNMENSSRYLNESNSKYDLIVTPKTFNVDEYKKVGANSILCIRYCYDPNIHYPVNLSNNDKEKYGSDLVFVGAMRKKRVDELEYIFNKGFDIRIWGTGWSKLNSNYLIKNTCTMKPVYAEDMSKVFQSSKIVLGFLNAENRDLHTARTYEVPACGGFFLAERTSEHQEIFKEGKEAEFFDDLDELCEKSNFYLKNEELRKKIAISGYEKVKKVNATYKERAKEILKQI